MYHGGELGVRVLTVINVREAGFIEAAFVLELIHVHKTLCGLWMDRHGVEGPNQKNLSALTLKLA